MSQSGSYSTGGGGGGGNIATLTGNTGGAVGPSGGGNINIVGTGVIAVTGSPGTNTLTISDTSPAAFVWNTATINTAMLVNEGYITNGAGQVQLLLPMAAAVGSTIRVTGRAATGWQVTQNAGQTIFFGNMTTTTGTGGSISSTATRDSIEIVCVVANSDWNVLSSVGNPNVV